MSNKMKDVDVSEVILGDQLEMDAVRAAAHLARQYRSIRNKVKQEADKVNATNKPHKEARLAAYHWILNQRAEAAEHAAKDTAHSVSQMVLGLVAEDEGKLEEALDHFEKAADKAPNSAACVLCRLGALRKLGRVDEALKLIAKLEREFGDKPNLFSHKGLCLEAQGKYEEALDCFDKALALDPEHAESLFHAGRILDLRGMDAEAAKYYEKIGPDANDTYVNAMLNLATLYEDLGKENEAMHCCMAVISQQPDNKRARMISESIAASAGMFYSPEETKQSEKLEAILRIPVTDFELSVRSRNCLAKMNIKCLGDLVKRTESEMLAYKNFGETSLREIRDMLVSRNLRLGMLREDAATRAAYNRSSSKMREEILAKPIEALELSVRSRKCMDRLGIKTIGELCDKSELELETAKNFGRVSLNEIKKRLMENNLSLRQDD